MHERLLPKWRSEKHAQQWINTLEQYAFPILGDKPLDEITVKNIAAVLFPIWIEKAETAVRLKQRIAEVLKWGMGYGYCDTNVALLVEPLLPIQESRTQRVEHQPALPFEKIPDFLKQHNITTKPTNITKALMLFLILTACRSGEARGATWAEIDFEDCVWTIPKERMKSGKEHRIPLSNQALCLLRELQQLQLDMNLIFPNRKGSALSDMVLTSFLRKKNVESDNPNRTATAHGFRSSFRNWCSENDVSSDIAERCLAHTISNRVEAAYNRTKLLDKRRPVMQDWADFVCSQIMPE